MNRRLLWGAVLLVVGTGAAAGPSLGTGAFVAAVPGIARTAARHCLRAFSSFRRGGLSLLGVDSKASCPSRLER